MIGTILFFPVVGWLNVGAWEAMLILLVVLILFGGRKIPQLAKDLGLGIREFRKSISGAAEDISAETSRMEELSHEESVKKTASKKTAKKSRSKKS